MPSYFPIAVFRNLWRNKLNSLINLVCLSLGLTVFAFALIYTRQEFSYDRSWENAERIHRVLVKQQGIPGSRDGETNLVSAVAYPALQQYLYDDIESITRIAQAGFAAPVSNGVPITLVINAVDPAFTDIFKLKVTSGSLDTVLNQSGFVAVEATEAAKFPQGPLTIGSKVVVKGAVSVAGKPQEEREFAVGAIFQRPAGSTTATFTAITAINDYTLSLIPAELRNQVMWNSSTPVWIKLKPAASLSAIQQQLPTFIDQTFTAQSKNLKAGEKVSDHLSYRLQPLLDVYFHPYDTEFNRGGDLGRVLTIAAIGALVLLVGCSNAISLNLAMVLERRRDIGIHKAVGALQGDIFRQYLGESLLLAMLSLIPAILLVEWLLPVFKTLLRMPLNLAPSLRELAPMTVIALLAGLASGAYPALVLAGVKPQQVLKTGAAGGLRSNHRLRLVLVGFQFCLAVTLMIGTLALLLQLQVVRNQPIGFDPRNLIYLSMSNEDQQGSGATVIINRLAQLPGILAVDHGSNPPNISTAIPANQAGQPFVKKAEVEVEATLIGKYIGPQQFTIVGIPLASGRMFDRSRDVRSATARRYSDEDVDNNEARVMVNRAATRALGFDTTDAAVDQVIFRRYTDRDGKLQEVPARIIGVVEDSMYSSLRSLPMPEIYNLLPLEFGSPAILLKYDDSVAGTIEADLKQAWQEVTGTPLQYITFVESRLEGVFLTERNESKVLMYCAGLALFLSCVGLYGLASSTMQRNIKEVGVRKVMGASMGTLLRLYLWRYAKPVLFASVLASPVAVYFILQWLQRFPYQMEKAWLLPLCLIAIATVLVIALLTVAGIVIKTTRLRPVLSLRYE